MHASASASSSRTPSTADTLRPRARRLISGLDDDEEEEADGDGDGERDADEANDDNDEEDEDDEEDDEDDEVQVSHQFILGGSFFSGWDGKIYMIYLYQ